MGEQASVDKVATEGERGRGYGWWISVVAFGILAAYPLSFGPVVKLTERGLLHPSGVLYFYAPLHAFCRKCPPADRFFRWYLDDVWKI